MNLLLEGENVMRNRRTGWPITLENDGWRLRYLRRDSMHFSAESRRSNLQERRKGERLHPLVVHDHHSQHESVTAVNDENISEWKGTRPTQNG